MSNDSVMTAVSARLVAMADDDLLLSQHNAAWCGQAPVSTHSNILSCIALDQVIQAQMWYRLASRLTGDNAPRDRVKRDAASLRSAALVEMPSETWPGALLREYLFDRYETTLLRCLRSTQHDAISDAATFMRRRKVEHAHQTLTTLEKWLAANTAQAPVVQAELDRLWPLAAGLFEILPGEADLMKRGTLPNLFHQQQVWIEAVRVELASIDLVIMGEEADVPSRLVGSAYRVELVELLAEASRSRSGAAI